MARKAVAFAVALVLLVGACSDFSDDASERFASADRPCEAPVPDRDASDSIGVTDMLGHTIAMALVPARERPG